MNGSQRIEDAFAAAELSPEWKRVRVREEDVRIEDGRVAVRIRPGSLYGPTNNAENLLVRPLPGQVSAMEIDVEIRLSGAYEQAGLFWYYDDDNYAKLVLEYIDNRRYVVLVREENAEAAVAAKIPVETDRVSLRFEVKGHTLSALFRLPGQSEWTNAASCPAYLKEGLHAGLIGHGGPEDGSRWAYYSDFRAFTS